MKKVLLFLITIILFDLSLFAQDDKAQELIKQYINAKSDVWKDYEPIEFETLDSVFSKIDWKLIEKADTLIKEAEKWTENPKLGSMEFATLRLAIDKLDSATVYITKAIEVGSLSIPEFVGWSMKHRFKAIDTRGNECVYVRRYTFDRNITNIISDEWITRRVLRNKTRK
jgi:hypothetical protein